MSRSSHRGPDPREHQRTPVLRLDCRLHQIVLAEAELYPLHPTVAGIVAVAALEERLTGATDPATMTTTPIQPRIEALLRLRSGAWVIGSRLSGLPGPAARLRHREIDHATGEALARACGHAVEPPATVEPIPGGLTKVTLFERVAGVCTRLVREGVEPKPTDVAERLGIGRTTLYKSHNHRSLELIRMMAEAHRRAVQDAARNRYAGDPKPNRCGGGTRLFRKSIESCQDDDR